MDINYVELGSICKKGSSNVAQKDLSDHKGKYPIYGASGFIMNVDFAHQNKPYIAVVKDGAGVGRVMLLPANSSVIGTMQYILPNDNVDIDYLFYALQYMNLSKYYSGATIPHIYFKDYQREKVLLPSLDIQRKKAEVLHKIDELKNLYNEYIVKFDTIIKSRFIEMFGNININDRDWDALPLGDLCTIVRGGSPRPIVDYLGGTIPWIKIGDATEGDDIYLRSTKEFIISEGIKKSRMVKAGSLIFANCGVSLGFARIITFDGCIHDGWLAMEDIDGRLNKIFLLQSLNQMTGNFRKMAPAGTQPNLNTTIMKAYMQILPPIKLQEEFISFIENVNKSELAVKASLEKLETLKKSLMQQYFG